MKKMNRFQRAMIYGAAWHYVDSDGKIHDIDPEDIIKEELKVKDYNLTNEQVETIRALIGRQLHFHSKDIPEMQNYYKDKIAKLEEILHRLGE